LTQIYFEIWSKNSLGVGWQNSLEFMFQKKEKKEAFSPLWAGSPFPRPTPAPAAGGPSRTAAQSPPAPRSPADGPAPRVSREGRP